MDQKGKKEFKKQLKTKGKKFKKRFLKFVIFQSKKKKNTPLVSLQILICTPSVLKAKIWSVRACFS